ncbi:hypothetical protein GCM10007416_24610 [Kroppenstedtia guangzhouensis]|uniref:DUF4025 domain-containing protein n=1 Tax=Kroppenstedtia guangzhouensis TaxID=1274356 RepID=A0ABQ1GUQ4_9BACL|nr:hypothetical protein [Kroppenstedtia guangzhouensis]GGA50535.1 hypothetical protein GCM10007416_24610 [Kroppenstedtia guangzhouensis]
MKPKDENEKNVYEKAGELTGQAEEGPSPQGQEDEKEADREVDLMQAQVYDGPVFDGPMDVMEKIRKVNEDQE